MINDGIGFVIFVFLLSLGFLIAAIRMRRFIRNTATALFLVGTSSLLLSAFCLFGGEAKEALSNDWWAGFQSLLMGVAVGVFGLLVSVVGYVMWCRSQQSLEEGERSPPQSPRGG